MASSQIFQFIARSTLITQSTDNFAGKVGGKPIAKYRERR